MVPVWVKVAPPRLVEAVIVSTPPQPLSVYEVFATPLTVVTGELIVAFPAAAQGEAKMTDCATVNGLDPFNTVTPRLAVPLAERLAGVIVSGLSVSVGNVTA